MLQTYKAKILMDNYTLLGRILTNAANTEEIEQFNTWLKSSPLHEKEFKRITKAWSSMDDVYKHKFFDKQRAKKQVLSRVLHEGIQKRRTYSIRVRSLAIAAGFALAIAVGLLVYRGLNDKVGQSFTALNRIENITLSDGTKVWLNANSTLTTSPHFGSHKRKVTLKGEAFFEVARDINKPFIIDLGPTKTKVLGTSFNLFHNTRNNNVELTVLSGKVTFQEKWSLANYTTVVANQAATYNSEAKKIIPSQNTSPNSLSWKTGKLEFYDTPIAQVCADLTKYYGKEIVCKAGDQIILTGVFDNENLDDVLNAIQLSLDLKLSITDSTYVLKR